MEELSAHPLEGRQNPARQAALRACYSGGFLMRLGSEALGLGADLQKFILPDRAREAIGIHRRRLLAPGSGHRAICGAPPKGGGECAALPSRVGPGSEGHLQRGIFDQL